jgi:hypothetical protein
MRVRRNRGYPAHGIDRRREGTLTRAGSPFLGERRSGATNLVNQNNHRRGRGLYISQYDITSKSNLSFIYRITIDCKSALSDRIELVTLTPLLCPASSGNGPANNDSSRFRMKPRPESWTVHATQKQKTNIIALLVLSLILCAIQAGVWARSTIYARSETDKTNIESQYPPNEIAGIVGLFLLFTTGVIASIPTSRDY